MEDRLIAVLTELYEYPIYRQGSLGTDRKYPEHFFTFWNNSSDSAADYDNIDHATIWDYDLNFYSIDPANIYTVTKKVTETLKDRGFTVSGRGYDVMSDEVTHTGRGINVLYYERNESEV